MPPSLDETMPHPGDWNLVIKVKYGDTLKRFNGCVNGSHFDYNLATLRSMIANVYKFSPGDDFILTYTDEDEDVVILDDDDDLHDATISQKLNPLRIDVQLKRTPQTKQTFGSDGSNDDLQSVHTSISDLQSVHTSISDGNSNNNQQTALPPPPANSGGKRAKRSADFIKIGNQYGIFKTCGTHKEIVLVGKCNNDLHSKIPTNKSSGKINGGLRTALPPPLANRSFNFTFNFIMPPVIPSYAPYQEGCSFRDTYIDLNNKYGSVTQHTVHLSIQCDGCRMTPIVEPH